MSSNLNPIDNTLILFYFAIVLFIGLYFSRNQDGSIKNYFLADKNLGWFAIGASLFATNISSEHLVGLAGAGSIHGLNVGYFEWMAAIILLFLGWFFAPIFLKANVNTVPQFFGKRFDDRSRIYLTIVSIFTYLFTKIAVTILAGGLVLREVLGWDMVTSAILIVLFTGLYTVIGGMHSVVNTQIFQTVILILGALALTVYSLFEVGGIAGLSERLPSNYFQEMKPFSDLNTPWIGILLGAPILGIWYWCSDQYIIQRILSARGINDARKGTVLASMLKIFPTFLFIIPGLAAAVLYPASKGDSAYSLLLSGTLLPIGIKGIVIAGFFSALMSSLSSSFNSAASLFALDIYQYIKPKASENEVVLFGRLATMLIIITAIAIIPLLKLMDGHIYIHLQMLQAYIAPPIISVFLFGIFWKKASSRGAIWGLIMGGILGFVKIIFTSIDSVWFSNNYLLKEFHSVSYLHFAVLLFFISSAIIVFFSLFDSKRSKISEGKAEILQDKEDVGLTSLYK